MPDDDGLNQTGFSTLAGLTVGGREEPTGPASTPSRSPVTDGVTGSGCRSGAPRSCQAWEGIQGHSPALLHGHRLRQGEELRPARPSSPGRGDGQAHLCRSLYGRRRVGSVNDTGRYDRYGGPFRDWLPGGSRQLQQDVWVDGDLRTDSGPAGRAHRDRPGTDGQASRPHPCVDLRCVARDDQHRRTRELPARRSPPRSLAVLAQGRGLRAQACAARAYAESARRASTGRVGPVLRCALAGLRRRRLGEREDFRRGVGDEAASSPCTAGRPIQAFYFSCSGGRTENIEGRLADIGAALSREREGPL